MKLLEKNVVKPKSLTPVKILIGLAIILIVAFLSYRIFFLIPCDDENCFVQGLKSCRHVSWIKEDTESAWLLTILGINQRDSCNVNFRLLNIKKGTIDSEKLIGKEMICIVLKTETKFPLEDISHCTGKLKEEMQDIIIKRMHDYLLKNIGEIKEDFKAV